MSDPKPSKPAPTSFQPPRGTRDFYPIEMARRLWLEDKWRRTAVRHGFDEIDGPTFEHLDLYTVKSGEGIVSELFSFSRAGGETPFALRPEFTPTLARMVATKANALPKPIKWFSIGPYFRAERPQRGRLREFLQWNVDCLGDDSPEADVEVVASCVEMLRSTGLTSKDVKIRFSNRHLVSALIEASGVSAEHAASALTILDRREKMDNARLTSECAAIGFEISTFDQKSRQTLDAIAGKAELPEGMCGDNSSFGVVAINDFTAIADHYDLLEWLKLDLSIVRGLAYYTGTVFEVHETAGAERAIAGGGRYDNLVELFGGPHTPAVGFAMGDVVVTLVLQDKGLMPSDEEIARDVGLTPDVFVLALPNDPGRPFLAKMTTKLRQAGLHARLSRSGTGNLGKLLQAADKAHARYAVILESDTRAQLKDLSSKEQHEIVANDLASLASAIAERITPPR